MVLPCGAAMARMSRGLCGQADVSCAIDLFLELGGAVHSWCRLVAPRGTVTCVPNGEVMALVELLHGSGIRTGWLVP